MTRQSSASEAVRPAELSDLEAVMRIDAASFAKVWTKQALTDVIGSEANGGPMHIYVCGDASVRGFIIYSLICAEAEIYTLAVAPEYRGRKAASALLAQLRFRADTVKLEVKKTNLPAVALYKKFGFKTVGERKAYYSDGCDALLMTWTAD